MWVVSEEVLLAAPTERGTFPNFCSLRNCCTMKKRMGQDARVHVAKKYIHPVKVVETNWPNLQKTAGHQTLGRFAAGDEKSQQTSAALHRVQTPGLADRRAVCCQAMGPCR